MTHKEVQIQHAYRSTESSINRTISLYRQISEANGVDDDFDLIKLAVQNYFLDKGTLTTPRQKSKAVDGITIGHKHINGVRYRWLVQLIPESNREGIPNIFNFP